MNTASDQLTDLLATETMPLPLPALSCGNDPGQLSVHASHELMQIHLWCSVDTCRVRRRARTTLVESGRMVLDERAEP